MFPNYTRLKELAPAITKVSYELSEELEMMLELVGSAARPRIEHPDAPSREPTVEEQPQSQFTTIEQVTVLQDQLSTMMEMLKRMAGPPHTSEIPPVTKAPLAADAPPAVEIPPAVKILPSETVQTHYATPTSRHLILVN
ncbi:hypothetical protein Adt_06904 [Abeliophyllum distichum]|uniref:Uncharacterized protein n=1 Tax=Abeliophyllum distichum TaxID=126358 RepID=A0ABD1VAE4_9LAMI